MKQYLIPTYFLDCEQQKVQAFAQKHMGTTDDPIEQAKSLYLAVRDGWKYNPFQIDLRKPALKASDMFTRDHGYCVEKANLLAATGRALGIPTRLGFAIVKNHIGAEKLHKLFRTELIVFHGYCEFFLEEKWVKATPAFNAELCAKFHVSPLDFDGKTDSIFQQFTDDGNKYMEYVHDYGSFEDLPHKLFLSEVEKHYPHLYKHRRLEVDGFCFIR